MVGIIFAKLGGLHIIWSYFEVLLEIIAMRKMGISERHAHIAFSSLNSKAKQEIAICLLEDDAKNSDLIKAIRRVANIATRNHLTHSLVRGGDETLLFIKRDISSGLKYKTLKFSQSDFDMKFQELCDAIGEIANLAGVTDDDSDSYARHLSAS